MTKFERVFVWTGGGLFVLALIATAWTYFVSWETAVPGRAGWASIVADVALFSLFALHHSVFARETIKRSTERIIRARLLRAFYVWVASLLLIAVLIFWRPVPGALYEIGGWPALPLLAAQLGGMWLIGKSVAKLDALELAGIRPASRAEPLQIAGPYRWVRHPLYLGWILALGATPHMTGNRLAFAAISSAYLLVAIPWEERSLVRTFGEPYVRYCREVRWRVLPYLY